MKINSDAKSNSVSEPPDDEVLREWRESAAYWQKHFVTIRTMFDPVTQALIEDAGITQGQRVLDIAGGSGEPSMSIAETVGPGGSVTCTDIAPEMVAAAESEARRLELTNVMFKQCSAEALPFEDSSFDVVVCRLGAMFFPDPVAALREMLRVLKHEGAIALAVWSKSELNPFFYVITKIVEQHLGATPPDPSAPSAFRFAEPGDLAQLLDEAGAIDVKERALKFQIAAPVSLHQFWEMRSETSGTLRKKVATISATERELLAQEVEKAVSEFFPNNQMSFPAEMILVTGTKR